MTQPHPLQAILRTLLDVHRQAFELRAHEAAFHALSGAGHSAEDLGDTATLEEIAHLAREHLRWIDVNDPQHRFSSASAALRQHQSIFEQLAVTATGMRQRIESDRRIEEMRSGR